MLRETVNHLRDLPRYRQILATLIRYGYRDVVALLATRSRGRAGGRRNPDDPECWKLCGISRCVGSGTG